MKENVDSVTVRFVTEVAFPRAETLYAFDRLWNGVPAYAQGTPAKFSTEKRKSVAMISGHFGSIY